MFLLRRRTTLPLLAMAFFSSQTPILPPSFSPHRVSPFESGTFDSTSSHFLWTTVDIALVDACPKPPQLARGGRRHQLVDL